MLSYCNKWIPNFSDKKPLAITFPLNAAALIAFNMLKKELENAALHTIDKCTL